MSAYRAIVPKHRFGQTIPARGIYSGTPQLQTAAVADSDDFYSRLIDSATHPDQLFQTHGRIVVGGLHRTPFLATKLVHSCTRLGLFEHARQVFDFIHQPNIFLWNAVIKACSKHGRFVEALDLYNKMLMAGTGPDGFTLPIVLRACAGVPAIGMGRAIHAQIYRRGFEGDVFVQNGLVAMYAKYVELSRASLVFEGLREKNVVSWTSMISGYVQSGCPLEALRFFQRMRSTSTIRSDFITLVSVLKAYTDIEDLGQGKSLHGYVIKVGLEAEIDLQITLTAMYAKLGLVLVAKSLFEQVPSPPVILWNAMISGYAKNGHWGEAVQLFQKMSCLGVRPDSITLRSAIMACAQVGSLEAARWIEDYVSNTEYKKDIFVNTALIDMYAKCGHMQSAQAIFDGMANRDTVLWSAIIVGYGLNSLGKEAIALFHEMNESGVKPNDVTFLGLLLACSHAGLVKEGWNYFHLMREYGIKPYHQHYACIVDLLSRSGMLYDAFRFILIMPVEPTVSMWGALLNACSMYGNIELGTHAAERVFSLDPSNAGHYVQLSNLYASAGMWDNAAKVRIDMRGKGVTKSIGNSFVEINGKLTAFRVSDKSNVNYKKALSVLDNLREKLKAVGFSLKAHPGLDDIGHPCSDDSICDHTEILAIAFGISDTYQGMALKIAKSSRTCLYCHSALKHISKVIEREIVFRDANRFHHFKVGRCSCGDYW